MDTRGVVDSVSRIFLEAKDFTDIPTEEKDSFVTVQLKKYLDAYERQPDLFDGDAFDTKRGGLAKVVLLDQVPRHVYRRTWKAFKFDNDALALASDLERRYTFNASEKQFLFLPRVHSENLSILSKHIQGMEDSQRRYYMEFEASLPPNSSHLYLLRTFGRYPYRNAVLGRKSTLEEELWLARPDLPPFALSQLSPHPVPSPVIGVLMQSLGAGGSYLSAAYVKWLESAGAQVRIIEHDERNVDDVYKSLNGLLLPGGADDLTDVTRRFLQLSSTQFEKYGRVFPVMGICNGFQSILEYLSPGIVESNFNARNYSTDIYPLEGANGSILFNRVQHDVAVASMRKDFFFHNERGVRPGSFTGSLSILNRLHILSVTQDRDGKSFVSSFEGRRGYPFYGLQFHPEKNVFEHGSQYSSHGSLFAHNTPHMSRISSNVAVEFVERCRLSGVRSKDFKSLVYNRDTTGRYFPRFMETYVTGTTYFFTDPNFD